MKAIVVIDSISRAAGGLFDAERRLHQELFSAGVEIAVLGLTDEFAALDSDSWNPIKPRVFPACRPVSVGWSPQFQNVLNHEEGDVLYRAGLWRLPSRAAHQWSRRQRKPEIIAPHGMLDSWAVQNSAWKKRIALAFYERKHLENAACIRALCESEAQSIRAFGLINPVCIIPNGIDIPEVGGQKSEVRNPFSILNSPSSRPKVLLYLGRIHPKKGLVNLLRAWSATLNSQPSTINSWCLAIAGWDQGGHEDELKRFCRELQIPFTDIREQNLQAATFNLKPSVLFVGPQFGAAKSACYANCDAFILPSFSEGLPMVILEAWAYCKPVLMTPECNLPEGFAANAALRIESTAESIAKGLEELFRTPHAALRTMGDNGRNLVAAKFTWPKIATNLKAVYDWVLGGGSKPDCVIK